jgi:1-deoxy-D-xylulose-5-phosphate synthase
MSLLKRIKDFTGIRGLSPEELRLLCAELREMILEVTLKNGGHLASSLGAVELNVALLRAFNPDIDKIIFDVGHQSYAYKILTGRLDRFCTLRTKGGIAGFPRMDESPYDFFTTGHSSTSISAAMGYAKARDLHGEKYNVVSVIGDGALINGVAFEALNTIQTNKSKVIIILNDNRMSINPRVGGMANHLAHISVNPTYRRLKSFIKEQCRSMKQGSSVEQKLGNIKTKLKSMLLPTNIFEQMDISYWGPFDGHNVQEMEEVFNLAKQYDKSLLIHVITRKGKGFKETESHPSFFHGIGPGTKLEAADQPKTQSAPGWSMVMANCLADLARQDDRVIACTAAMKDGTKLGNFEKEFPERFFDTGIAEEHLLIFAAGMAAGGLRPAVCIYSTFLQRGADQIAHDICLPDLPVLLCIDRAGLVGEDGETHHGLLDIVWLRAQPNMVIAAPRDAVDLRFFVKGWLQRDNPMAIRYSRGTADESIQRAEGALPVKWGKLEIMQHGSEICLIGVGSTVKMMLSAAEKLAGSGKKVTVVDLRFIKPIDFASLDPILKSSNLTIIAEEGYINGGVGSAIAAHTAEQGYNSHVVALGVPDKFISHAKRNEQLAECGLTVEHIVEMCNI